MNEKQLWDDSSKDFRRRYDLPDQFVWDLASWPRIDFDGYMSIIVTLLPTPPATILDVGCGPGLGAKMLNGCGYDVTGIDYNQRAIGFAKILVPDVTFFQEDVRLLSEMVELHERFDAAILIEVIEHIPPDFYDKVLQGIADTLRPTGTLILTAPSSHMPMNSWHYKHFDLAELVPMIERNRFQIAKVVYQHRMGLLFSRKLWRLLCNKYYDIRFARRILRTVFLNWYNTTTDASRAGRFIVQAERII